MLMCESRLWIGSPRPFDELRAGSVSPRNGETRTGHPRIFVLISLLLLTAISSLAQEPVGIFENHADVGAVLHAGTASFDATNHTYTLTGSGENMWSTADAFQFVWKKASSGDLDLSADISFLNKAGNEHKKAVLIFRQSLDADSVYADIALHGNGMAALQYRDEKGAATHEIQSRTSAPTRLRITRRGDYVYMSAGASGQDSHYDGESFRVPLQGAFYVGIGVCAHNKD